MITPINCVAIPYINFRSNHESMGSLGFQPRMRQPLLIDIFEKTTSGGINGSKNSAEKIQDLFPFAKVKSLAPSTRETERNKRIEEEKKHIAQTITKRTEYNKSQLRSAGIKESDLNKYLTYDGHVNSEGKRILKEKGKSYK